MAEPTFDGSPQGVGRFLLEERFGQNFPQQATAIAPPPQQAQAATPAPAAAPTAMASGIGSLPVGPDFSGYDFSNVPIESSPTLFNSGAQSAAPGYDPATATFGPQNTADIGFPSTVDFGISQAIGLDERAMQDLQDYYERTGTGPNLSDGQYRSQPPDDYYDNKPPPPKPSDDLDPPDYTPVDTLPPDDSGYTQIPPDDVITEEPPPMSSYTPVPPPPDYSSRPPGIYPPPPPSFDPRIPQPPMYTPVSMFPQTKTLQPPGRRYPSNMVEQIVYEEKQTNPLYTPIYTSGVFSGG